MRRRLWPDFLSQGFYSQLRHYLSWETCQYLFSQLFSLFPSTSRVSLSRLRYFRTLRLTTTWDSWRRPLTGCLLWARTSARTLTKSEWPLCCICGNTGWSFCWLFTCLWCLFDYAIFDISETDDKTEKKIVNTFKSGNNALIECMCEFSNCDISNKYFPSIFFLWVSVFTLPLFHSQVE